MESLVGEWLVLKCCDSAVCLERVLMKSSI